MDTPDQQELGRIHPTANEQKQLERATGRSGEVIEFRVEELEERIAPRLASNHNETLLVDR